MAVKPKIDPRFMYWGTGYNNTSLTGDIIAIPFPSEGPFETSRAVDAARNAQNVVVGQMVGRAVDKQSMKWFALPCEKWWEINRWLEAHGMFFYAKYFAHNTGRWMIRRFYCGDPKTNPYIIDPGNGEPRFYVECELNVIDTGNDVNIIVSEVAI